MTVPYFERISDYVPHWAATHPDREALVGGATRWTYRDLDLEVDRISTALLRLGVGRGDRVALLGRSHPLSFAHFLATASLGAIWVGLNPKYTRDEIAAVVSDSRPAVVFVMVDEDDGRHTSDLQEVVTQLGDPVQLVTWDENPSAGWIGWPAFVEGSVDHGGLRSARALVHARDAAAMIYTSGTTGRSKGALVPHVGLTRCGVVQTGRWYGDAPRKLCDLPLNHIGGLGDICTSILVAGGTVVFMERFDAAEALRQIEKEQLTHVYWIPTQLLAVVDTPEWDECDLTSLEWILWGGAAAPVTLLRKLAQKCDRLGTSYSLTESTGSVTYTDEGDSLDTLSWSVGKIDPHYEVRILDADGRDVGPGEDGEVNIRGEHITLGYFGRPEATAEAVDQDGWLHTGDLARLEPNGHLRLVGRLKEMYKSGGYNVYPREVETAIEEHPAVSLAAVIGVPDDRWGEVGHAFVVAEGLSTAELDSFLESRLANYKRPKRLWIEQTLPTLPIGKVDKSELRRRVAAQAQS